MDLSHDDTLIEIRDALLEGMLEYMEPDEEDPDHAAAYTKEHVERCGRLLDAFLGELSRAAGAGEDAILACVERVVLALNALNEEADCELIETDQREELCELIITAAGMAGLEVDEDITEEWRTW